MRNLITHCRESAMHVTIFALTLVAIGSLTTHASNTLTPGWNSLGGNRGEISAVNASPSGATSVGIDFTLPGFSTQRVLRDSKTWHNITFPDQCNADVIGAPDLPLMRRYIAVPKGSSVKVEILDVKFEVFDIAAVQPHQRPLLEMESPADRVFAIDKRIYSTDSFYPGKWASVLKTIVMHGVHLALLEINPLRYNPVTGKLQAASEITCRVTYNGGRTGSTLKFPSNLEKVVEALAINYNFMPYRPVPTKAKMNNRRATDYLIISDGAFVNSSSLKNLTDYYTAAGYSPEVKNVADLNSDTNTIKQYIQGIYDQGELDYVLLIGDLPSIPQKRMRDFHDPLFGAYYDTLPSDAWYFFLDGTDYAADVAFGRFPATDQTELDYMITKTLDFHNRKYPGDWEKKVMMVAHGTHYPTGTYTVCSRGIMRHNYTLETPVMDSIFGSTKINGHDVGNADVTAGINEGRLVVNYRGHGQPTCWRDWNKTGGVDCDKYSTTHAAALQNGHKTPVVFNIACSNANMLYSEHCLGEAFICQEQGAVAVLGCTKPSNTDANNIIDSSLFLGTWDKGIKSLGVLVNYAMLEGIKAYPGMAEGGSGTRNAATYTLFGDPLLSLFREATLFITLISPNGGEHWVQDSATTITWGDNIDGEVKIELYKSGSLKETLASATESDGSFIWQIPSDFETGNDYKVKISSVDSSALFYMSDTTFLIDAATAITTLVKTPASFNLHTCGSRVFFNVPVTAGSVSRVSLKLYSIQGKLVNTLVDENVKAGYHSVSLNTTGRRSRNIGAGMYLCRMEAGNFTKTIKILR